MLGSRVRGLGLRDITPLMEGPRENHVDNEMDTRVIHFKGSIYSLTWLPSRKLWIQPTVAYTARSPSRQQRR